MSQLLYALVAVIHLVFSALLARALGQRFTLSALVALVVALGLVYDNAVIAAGTLVGEGPALEGASWPRYRLHALATPLLIVFASEVAVRVGLEWAHRRWARALFLVGTVAMIAYGVALGLPSALEPSREGGVLTYEPAGSVGAPVPPIVTNLALVVVGVALWARRRWPWLAVTSVTALLGFGLLALGPPPIVGQVAEVVLMAGIVAAEGWSRREAAATRGTALG